MHSIFSCYWAGNGSWEMIVGGEQNLENRGRANLVIPVGNIKNLSHFYWEVTRSMNVLLFKIVEKAMIDICAEN